MRNLAKIQMSPKHVLTPCICTEEAGNNWFNVATPTYATVTWTGHVQPYYRIIYKQNPFNIISRGVQGCTSTDVHPTSDPIMAPSIGSVEYRCAQSSWQESTQTKQEVWKLRFSRDTIRDDRNVAERSSACRSAKPVTDCYKSKAALHRLL